MEEKKICFPLDNNGVCEIAYTYALPHEAYARANKYEHPGYVPKSKFAEAFDRLNPDIEGIEVRPEIKHVRIIPCEIRPRTVGLKITLADVVNIANEIREIPTQTYTAQEVRESFHYWLKPI